MGQDHTRVASSVDKEDAPRRLRAQRASTPCTMPAGASTPHSDAGVESRIAVPHGSRGIYQEYLYRDTHSTRSVASVPEERLVTPPTMHAWATSRGRGNGDRVHQGPGPCFNVEEARGRIGYLTATPTSRRLGVASQGVGQANLIRLGCHDGCSPRDLAALRQGHASESPGGLIHPSGAVPLQFPSDLFVPFLTARTESGMEDWRPCGPLGQSYELVTKCVDFSSTGGVLESSASFASASGSTFDSDFDEISVISDDSLPRPHPLTLCPSSPSLTAASTFESTACLASDRVGVAGESIGGSAFTGDSVVAVGGYSFDTPSSSQTSSDNLSAYSLSSSRGSRVTTTSQPSYTSHPCISKEVSTELSDFYAEVACLPRPHPLTTWIPLSAAVSPRKCTACCPNASEGVAGNAERDTHSPKIESLESFAQSPQL